MIRAVLPFLHCLLLYLCIPYALSWGLAPLTVRALRSLFNSALAPGFLAYLHPLIAESDANSFELGLQCMCHVCFRYAFTLLLVAELARAGALLATKWYMALKQSMIEERYVIGKRLHNFGEARTAGQVETKAQTPSSNEAGAAAAAGLGLPVEVANIQEN
eukprot:1336594-Amorphochlora_amoeboformis.AAC.1